MQIDKNVPLPAKPTPYPWAEMEPGDSILIPIGNRTRKQAQSSVAASAFGKFGAGNYRTAFEGEGVRVWRLK